MTLQHQLCFEVYKAANQFTKLYAKTLQPFRLTYAQYLVLLALQDEDHQTTSSLCDKLSLGIGTLNPIIQKLVDKGWVTKHPSPSDRRASILSRTAHTKQTQPQIEKEIYDKLACSSFLQAEGPALKERVAQLNAFLQTMNQEDSP